MKNSIKLFVAAAVLVAGCSPKKDKYEAFADDLCVCMRPMADFQKELTTLIREWQPRLRDADDGQGPEN
jgi:hypothetical protein